LSFANNNSLESFRSNTIFTAAIPTRGPGEKLEDVLVVPNPYNIHSKNLKGLDVKFEWSTLICTIFIQFLQS